MEAVKNPNIIIVKPNLTKKVNIYHGAKGEKGDQGIQGVKGADGQGVIDGGTTGQVLAKKSNTDYDTEWITNVSAPVTSVNTQTGAVVLDADDISDSLTTKKFTNQTDITRLANTSGTNTGDQDLSGLLPNSHLTDFAHGDIAHSNRTALNAVSGTNTGDQDLSGKMNIDQTTPQTMVGTFDLPVVKTDRLLLDTTYTVTGSEPIGSIYWNATDGTADLKHNGATQQIGQELFIKVINKTGLTITEGNAVYFNGRQGSRPKIALAMSDIYATSNVNGITTEDILDNAEGFITIFGYVRQIKTNYSGSGIWGTTWAEGDKLYVSKTDAGQLTNIEPIAPHYSDVVGEVGIVGGVGGGSILILIERHKTLEGLSDINGTALTTTGQIPVWNNSSKYFDFNYNLTNYELLSNKENTTLDTSTTKYPTNRLVKEVTDGKQPYHGFVSRALSTMSFVGATRIFTLARVSDYVVYVGGIPVTVTGNKTVMISNTDGLHFITMNATGTLASSTTAWSLLDLTQTLVAIVWYDTTASTYRLWEERHGSLRNVAWHRNQHLLEGAKWGGGLTGTFTTSTVSIIAGTVADEDIDNTTAGTITRVTHVYKATGGVKQLFDTTPSASIIKTNGTNPVWDNNGTLTAISNNNYGVFWVYGTNDITSVAIDATNTQIVAVVGQGDYSSVANAQAAPRPTFNTALNTAEWVLLYRVIIRRTSGSPAGAYTQADDLRAVTSGPAITGGTGLASVSHDDTLLGTGTSSDPLQVAWNRTAVADLDYTALTTDYLIGYSSITATRTVTLPTASTFRPGKQLRIVDESGSITPAINILIARSASDTIEGATSILINIPYGEVTLVSNGTSKWNFVGQFYQRDVFLVGGASTYTKPLWAKSAKIQAIGGGAGGGSGRKGAAGAIRCGGGGGSGGGYSEIVLRCSQMDASGAIVVGAGGTGGVSQTTNTNNGNAGNNGGVTSCTFDATNAYMVRASFGFSGAGGTATNGIGGSGSLGALFNSSGGATAGSSGGAGAAGVIGAIYGASGGAGGGITTGDAASNGGLGGNRGFYFANFGGGTQGLAAGTVAGGNGTAGIANVANCGGGGGGGASSISTNAGVGGNGALYGSGGGGGGASVNSIGNSGAGGNGADGIIVIHWYSWFTNGVEL